MSDWDGRCSGCAYIGDVRHMATGPGFTRWCHDCCTALGLDVGPKPFAGLLGDQPAGVARMSADLPADAITAAAVAIHDADCPDRTCNGSALGHCYKLARAALSAALPGLTAAITAQAAAAEREACIALAIERKAVYVVWHKDIKRYRQYPFADLLGGTADGAHPGGAT